MKVRSTGLGKTMMVAAPEQLSPTTINPETLEEGTAQPVRLLFQVKTIQPVIWTIRVFLESSDIRGMCKLVLKPKVFFGIVVFVIKGLIKG